MLAPHRGGQDPGAHGVHAHARRRELRRERLGEADHGELARAVGRAAGVAALARHRRDVHDAPARLEQRRDRGARHQEDALHVDREHAVPARLVELDERLEVHHARVVHEHVDAPEGVAGVREQGLDLVAAGDVAGHRHRAHALLRDLLLRRLELGAPRERVAERGVAGLEIGQHDVRARPREAERDPAPDPARRARHDRRLALELTAAHRRPRRLRPAS
jgi:hypothetical protein